MMLQTLLADQFKVLIRNDKAPRPAYVLTAATNRLCSKRGTNFRGISASDLDFFGCAVSEMEEASIIPQGLVASC